MKVSKYNLYIPLQNKYVLYNMLTDAVLIIDEDLKESLTGTLKGLDSTIQKSLTQYGILVPDYTDEKALLAYQYQVAKYSADFISVLLLPTYACNLSCNYCPNPGKPVFMSKQTTDYVITFLKSLVQSTRLGVVLKLYGGEPLLHGDCCHVLCKTLSSFCQNEKVPFMAAAMTNGTLLTHRKTELLLPYLGAIHVTLDGSKLYHDTIRYYSGGKGTYGDIMEGLSLAREKGMLISVRINITAENLDSIEELLRDLKTRAFDEYTRFEIHFGPIAPLEECKYFTDDASSQKSRTDTFELVPRIREIINTVQWKGKIRDIISDLRSVSKPEQCSYAKAYTFVIDPLGDFYICPAFVGNSEYCAGSVRKGVPEFTSLYYNIRTRDAMQLECQDCVYTPVCGGGCPVRAYVRNKTVDSPYCGSTKELTGSRMLLYLKHKKPDLFRMQP
ncbi:MAG: SPASM domain-containing protein [Theionarchaea archaeon]|nr:SPASM domain-containing protein [Theionarchaea archaeon]